MLTVSQHRITEITVSTIEQVVDGSFVCVDIYSTQRERVQLFVREDTAELVAAGLRAAAEHIEAYAKDNKEIDRKENQP